jgi:mannose/fructose/N-acetylgalactosamine-specific phosphotransferase system component IIC
VTGHVNTGKTKAAEASTMYKVSTGTSGAVRAIAIPIATMMRTMLTTEATVIEPSS